MPTLKYTLSSRVYQGKAEVLVRFYAGKDFSQRAKSHIHVPADAWDAEAGAIIIPRKVALRTQELFIMQNRLDTLRNTIFSAWWETEGEAGSKWLQDVIDEHVLTRKGEARLKISELVRKCEASKNIKDSTAEQYEVLANALDRYGVAHGDFYCDNFKPDHVERFVEFFKKEIMPRRSGKGSKTVQRGNNTIVTKLKRLAAACAFGVRKGLLPETPFGKEEDGKFQIPTEVYGTANSLRIKERDAIQNYDYGDTELNLFRDIFIFQCHVGCRVSDLEGLTTANITDDGFLQYIQDKLISVDPQTVRVPLDDVASGILARYSCEDGRLFPVSGWYKYNEMIHTIARIAGLTRNVLVLNPITGDKETKELWEICTSHIARKTFMQHIFRQTKDAYITSSFTGHSPNTKVFKRYATVDDDIKVEIINKVQENAENQPSN